MKNDIIQTLSLKINHKMSLYLLSIRLIQKTKLIEIFMTLDQKKNSMVVSSK